MLISLKIASGWGDRREKEDWRKMSNHKDAKVDIGKKKINDNYSSMTTQGKTGLPMGERIKGKTELTGPQWGGGGKRKKLAYHSYKCMQHWTSNAKKLI